MKDYADKSYLNPKVSILEVIGGAILLGVGFIALYADLYLLSL